ncbi:MAG: signal peptide peptidase SppA, partial [Ignavibacteriae bacterium]|nr:signal peptide peptidase SppA [Ignavibacteriota bacterium]
ASVLGFFIAFFLMTVLFFIFTFAMISAIDTEETVSVKSNSVLEIKLDYDLPERSSKEPILELGMVPNLTKSIGLNDLQDAIYNAKIDENIKGIFLDLDNFASNSIVKLGVVRESLKDFKESGKFIIAHGNTISEAGYFLGSVADSIYLTQTGNMEFDGFGIEMTFFKKALDKLEVEPQIFQYGKYKSATEPFRISKMSDENREQIGKYVKSVYDDVIDKISKSKNISTEELKSLAGNLEINSAVDAKKYGLITALKYDDEVDSVMAKLIFNSGKEDFNKISFKKYVKSYTPQNYSSDNRIAIIYALGEITNGKGDETTIGTENIIEALDKAKENKRVKAIVMRVNSGGGSALTSDMIWRKVKLVQKEKPVIASFGNVAASGGYYIACGANKIVAEQNSLTGSIGVYGIIPNAQRFFDEKLGITFDRVQTSKNSGWATITNPLNEVQKKYIQSQIDKIYIDFASRVAEGRKMPFEQVDEIGQGRIWSGVDAKSIGLVDTLGGMDLALKL